MNFSKLILTLLSALIFASTAVAQEEAPTLSLDDLLSAIDSKCVCEFDPETESEESEEKLRNGKCNKIISKMKLVSRVLVDLGILVSDQDRKALGQAFKDKKKECRSAQKEEKKSNKGPKGGDDEGEETPA